MYGSDHSCRRRYDGLGHYLSRRTADAIYKKVESGCANAADFPLLLHIRELLEENAPVCIPWTAFETEYLG